MADALPDLSGMTPDQLLALHAQLAQPTAAPGSSGDITAANPLTGLSPEDLLRMYDSVPPEQMTGAAREVALPASNLAKGALSLLGMPGTLGDLGEHAMGKYVTGPLVQSLTGQAPAPDNSVSPLSSQGLTGMGQQAGIVDRSDLQPQNEREKLEAAGAVGLGGALPLAAVGDLPQAATLLAQGVGSGVGGEVGKQVVPSHPLLGSLAGSLIGGGLGTSALNMGSKAVNLGMGQTSPIFDAYKRLGIDTSLAGDVTGSPALQQIQAFASKAPGGVGRIEDASGKALEGYQNAVESTASNLGNSQTLQDAGGALQSGAKDWLTNFKNTSAQKWGAVDSAIPTNTPVSIAGYDAALDDIGRTMTQAKSTAEQLQPGLSRNLFKSLQTDTGVGGTLPWGDVKAIRTRIGEMLSDPNLPGDTGLSELKRIYAGLSSDMTTAAQQAGPQAEAALNDANAFTRNGHDFIQTTLSPIAGKGVSPEQAAKYALSSSGNGGTRLTALRQQMPDATDELAAYKLRDMALANPGAQNATGTAASPGTFLTDLNKMAPEAHQALFADPATQQRVSDLATVSQAIKQTASRANTSGTGAHNQLAGILGLSEALPAGYAGYEMGGVPGAIAGAAGATALPFVGGNAAARMTSSPALTRFLSTPSAGVPLSTMARIGLSYPAVASQLSNLLQRKGP